MKRTLKFFSAVLLISSVLTFLFGLNIYTKEKKIYSDICFVYSTSQYQVYRENEYLLIPLILYDSQGIIVSDIDYLLATDDGRKISTLHELSEIEKNDDFTLYQLFLWIDTNMLNQEYLTFNNIILNKTEDKSIQKRIGIIELDPIKRVEMNNVEFLATLNSTDGQTCSIFIENNELSPITVKSVKYNLFSQTIVENIDSCVSPGQEIEIEVSLENKFSTVGNTVIRPIITYIHEDEEYVSTINYYMSFLTELSKKDILAFIEEEL